MSTGRVGSPSRPRLSPGSITDPSEQAWALAGVVEALATTGDVDRAEAVARSITDPSRQAWALAGVARALATTGDADRAEAVARSITDPSRQAVALADVVRMLIRVRKNVYRPGNAINSTNSVRDDIAVVQMAKTPDKERIQQLLASALTQTTESSALLHLIAEIEPAAVIKIAQNITHLEKVNRLF